MLKVEFSEDKFAKLCAAWYHLDTLKNVDNTHGEVLKIALLYGCFSRFLNCTNGTKSKKAFQLKIEKKKKNRLKHLLKQLSKKIFTLMLLVWK